MKRNYKVKEIIKILKENGWYEARPPKGSHRQFKHPTIKGTVTISGAKTSVIAPKTLESIERQSGIKFKE
jgi:predicted RNA binding protein YcfA (HicA-like mRNA interferase family)